MFLAPNVFQYTFPGRTKELHYLRSYSYKSNELVCVSIPLKNNVINSRNRYFTALNYV